MFLLFKLHFKNSKKRSLRHQWRISTDKQFNGATLDWLKIRSFGLYLENFSQTTN